MKILYILIFFFLFTQTVSAAGLAVEPSSMYFESWLGQNHGKNLTVENISDREMIYQLYFEELTDQLTVNRQTLRLLPGQVATVKVSANPSQAGILSTNLAIVGQALDRRDFNASFGVKVPVTITVSQIGSTGFNDWQIAIIIPFLLIGLGLCLRAYRKARQKHFWRATINLLYHRPWWKRIF